MKTGIQKTMRSSAMVVFLMGVIVLSGCQSKIGFNRGSSVPSYVLRCTVSGPAVFANVRIEYDGPTDPILVRVMPFSHPEADEEFRLERKSQWEDITLSFSKSKNRITWISWNYGGSSIDDVPPSRVVRSSIDFGRGEQDQVDFAFFEKLAKLDNRLVIEIDEH
jgi:hypothetical protein